MKRDWKLDKNELLTAYKSKNTSLEEKLCILELMHLRGGNKFELFGKPNKKYINNINLIKEIFLNMMKKDYNELGESFLKYIIELDRLNIFRCDMLEPIYKNNIDKVADITLEVYSKYSNLLYKNAKDVLDNKCVLVVENIDSKSYMTFLNCINKPICVVDKSDNPNTLIHEVEHAIEAKLRYRIPEDYDELGAITFETLFIDELVDKKIKGTEALYYDRIRESIDFHKDLVNYYMAILYAKRKNFKITNSEFIIMMTEIMNIEKKNIISYSNDLFFQDLFNQELLYFLSFIKSIEIRNMILNDKKLGLKYLRECLNGKDLSFNEKENFNYVKQYIKEIKKKNK